MGEVRVRTKLVNAVDEALLRRGKIVAADVRTYEADALIDTGAVVSIIPVYVFAQLGLMASGRTVAEYADGRREAVDVTEPVVFEINGRRTTDESFVIGDEVLIGQTVLEKLDLLVDCNSRKVVPNPAHPDQPVLKVK